MEQTYSVGRLETVVGFDPVTDMEMHFLSLSSRRHLAGANGPYRRIRNSTASERKSSCGKLHHLGRITAVTEYRVPCFRPFKRAAGMANGSTLFPDDLPLEILSYEPGTDFETSAAEQNDGPSKSLEQIEAAHIEATLGIT